jgi:hypothetical protein
MGVEYTGVNFNNLRKALYLMFFGVDPIKDRNGKIIKALSQDFSSPKYKYIIPLQGNFDNPLIPGMEEQFARNTFIMYWIDRDVSLTQDDYTEDEHGVAVDRQKCVATVFLRFIGKEAETWVKTFRHLTKREGVGEIFYGVCNAEKLEYTMPVVPRKINYFGKNSQIAFDVRFKLYYDECIRTGWQPLEGIDFKVEGHIYVDDKKEE